MVRYDICDSLRLENISLKLDARVVQKSHAKLFAVVEYFVVNLIILGDTVQ